MLRASCAPSHCSCACTCWVSWGSIARVACHGLRMAEHGGAGQDSLACSHVSPLLPCAFFITCVYPPTPHTNCLHTLQSWSSLERMGQLPHGSRMQGCRRPACARHTQVRQARCVDGCCCCEPRRPPSHTWLRIVSSRLTHSSTRALISAEMLVMVRNLYQKCRLVHADLSGGYRCCRLLL